MELAGFAVPQLKKEAGLLGDLLKQYAGSGGKAGRKQRGRAIRS